MQDWPKVSVRIRTYNRKAFLAECLESVLAQDYPNFEIVVADDASTDGTRELLRENERKHPGLFKLVMAEQNEGHTRNANRAFFACTGKYIAWLDDDDLMLPGKLKKQAAYMESRPGLAFSYHDMEWFDSSTGATLRCANSGKGSARPREGGAEKLLRYGWFIVPSSVMLRRSACPPKGHEEQLPVSSEWLFLIGTAAHGQMGFLPEVLGRYRRHAGNVSVSRLDRFLALSITVALVEANYPQLVKYTRFDRARLFYGRAVRAILDHDWAAARPYLFASLRQAWVSWKWFGWLARSLIKW